MIHLVRTICLVFSFFILSFRLFAQNQLVADSLIQQLATPGLSDSSKLALLRGISFNHPNPDTILAYSERLISLADQSGSDPKLLSGYLQKGNALRLKGDLDAALSAYLKSLDYAIKLNQVASIGAIQVSIADIYSIGGNTENAATYYTRGIEILRQIEDSVSLSNALLNFADELYNNQRYDTALVLLEEAGLIFEQIGHNLGAAYYLGNSGMIYAEQGKDQLAEDNINQAIALLEDLKDYYPIAVYLNIMSGIYMEKGDLNTAIGYARRSHDLATRYALKDEISEANEMLSSLYEHAGDFDQSLHHFKQYITYRDSVKNIETVQEMANLRTEFEVAQKQVEVDLLQQEQRNQRIVGIALSVILALSVVLVVVLYRNYQHKLKTNKQLEDLNHTKDQFFSIISHDLRGPVSAFYNITKIIRMHLRKKQYDRLVDMADNIDHGVAHLGGLLDNLLSWAVQQQGQFPYNPENISLYELIDEVLHVFDNRAEAKRIDLHFEMDEDLHIWADRNSAMTIFRNLISNAIKFTPEDGEILVKAVQLGDMAQIAVTDTGVGIPPDKLDSLFQLKAKKSTYGTSGEKGLGVGLQLVQEFTHMNKGQIEVKSEVGTGTTFIVTLPLTKKDEPASLVQAEL